ncbi:hypothetical protein HN51_008031 [Arachis hypogaea]|uniref:Protein BIG GRAIN 1-like E n=2 Tax=Arachis TaxID=3817 RepID=A0A445D5S1_ARAHY|nr:protein BIG GRAIN 1-like E [Arachis duranensis]XP_025700325.1 protein BIG GRAIN 1-like E [Arachis hypogaea]QHO42323.1 Protein BIG GRAIN 1-like E [Arachis hypogaea]RYR58360.1 hypothetical protein Ahy_A05g024064 [Arachis hypogaea]
MSITGGLIDKDIMNHHKKTFHRRNDSGELDVFEAARYFSGYNESVIGHNKNAYSYSSSSCYSSGTAAAGAGAYRTHHTNRARISLDMPMRSLLPQQFHGVVADHHLHQKPSSLKNKENKKVISKQPSSPGGRLASFLNSLFSSQSASSKKKKPSWKSTASSSSSSKSTKDNNNEDHDEFPAGGWRRRRRSSISHFGSSSSTDASDSSKSALSGFRTPPPCVHAQTPTKCSSNFKNFSLDGHDDSNKTAAASTAAITTLQNEFSLFLDEKKKRDPKTTTTTLLLSEKQRNWISELAEKEKKWLQENNNNRESMNDDEIDEGAESDSSSDLFELQNYDLGYYSSSGLPVYETTNMDSIKRAAPISNGPL